MRRVGIAAAALVIAACGGGDRPPTGIVVVVVDTLRADAVGLHGAEWDATPAIDALAPESVVFDRAYAQASWTRPSVPTLLTGLYPSEHGVTGFSTAASGPGGKAGRGVKETVGAALSSRAETLAEILSAGGYRTDLTAFQAQLSPRFNLGQGFDQYENNVRGGGAAIVREFLRWLDREPGRPFFAYLHFLDIHWPYCPPPRFFGRFDAEPTTMDVCGRGKELRAELEEGKIHATDADRRALRARYAEAMLALDGHLGELFAALRERRLWDSTLVVVTADHGQEFGEHGGFNHGETLFEEMLRVPFVWKLPAGWRGRGRHVGTMVETRSLLPTLAAAAGRPVPAGATAPDLGPWLAGTDGGRAAVDFVAAESNGLFAVRDSHFKLVVEPARASFRLYDEVEDPGETRDVAAARPDELARMRSLFRGWRARLVPLPPDAGEVALDAETEGSLRALGYLR